MAVRLDFIFTRACAQLKHALSQGSVSFSTYGSNMRNFGVINDSNICNVGRSDDDASNITLDLSYAITLPDDVGALATYNKSRRLNLLCTLGDCMWTHNMINYVWNGDYPSTTAYDADDGEVFLVYLRNNCLELRHFAALEDNQLSRMEQHDFNMSRPFRIKVKEDAMFAVLDGAEGYNYLKDNVYIEFNSTPPMLCELQFTAEKIC